MNIIAPLEGWSVRLAERSTTVDLEALHAFDDRRHALPHTSEIAAIDSRTGHQIMLAEGLLRKLKYTTPSMTTHDAISVVAHPRRRLVLKQLKDGEQYTAEELARIIATQDQGQGESHLSDRDALVALVHNHLPRLQEYGIIEYDRREKVVARGDRFSEIQPVLEKLPMGSGSDEHPVSTHASS